jgi:hypothetical protein
MKKHKGESNGKAMSLLQASALTASSLPFGSELASWDQGVAVDCCAEWSQEAIDLASERGRIPQPKKQTQWR